MNLPFEENDFSDTPETRDELIVILDDDLKISWISKKMEEILGFNIIQLLGGSILDSINDHDKKKTMVDLERILEIGESEIEFEIQNRKGHFVKLIGSGRKKTRKGDMRIILQMTEKIETKLREIEWLLEKENLHKPEKGYIPFYGDITELNTEGIIKTSVGRDTLEMMISDIMDLLDTSLAVYERNGDYAFGMFVSGWCQAMDASSRRLCGDVSNRDALTCGKWLCHENCWNESALSAMEKMEPTDIDCIGGIRLYAVPIFADGDVIGAINIGYGNPPVDEKILDELANEYNMDPTDLRKIADEYKPRPPFIINMAKSRLRSVAKMIGNIVVRKKMENKLQEREELLDQVGSISKIGGWEMDLVKRTAKWTRATYDILEMDYDDEIPGPDEHIDYYQPEYREMIEQAMDDLIQKGVDLEFTAKLKTIKGNVKWCRALGKRAEIKNGRCVKIRGTFQDITQARRSEEEKEAALERVEKRAKELSSLLEGAGHVLEGADFKITSRAIFDIAREMTGAKSGYMALQSEDGTNDEIIFQESGELPDDVEPDLPILISGLRGESYRTGEVVYNNDFMNSEWIDFVPVGHIEIINVMISPLIIEGETVGVMCLANKEGDFTEDERKMVEALGQLAAIALKNSRTMDALIESEERYRSIFDTAANFITSINKEGIIVDCNERVNEVLGYEKDEILGQPMSKIFHPDVLDEAKESLNDILTIGMTLNKKFKMVKKKGEEIDVSINSSGLKGTNGRYFRTISIIEDVTEKNRILDDLRRSEERYRTLVETINSGVAIYQVKNNGLSGKDYIIQSFNRRALEIEEKTLEEVRGKSLKDLRPNIDEYGLIPIFREVWETGKPAFYPAKIYVDENYSNYYENRVFRLPSKEIVAIYDDVTERVNATERVRESESRFDLAMNAARDGLWDWNLISNDIYFSPGWKRMLGYEDHELPNKFSVWEDLTENPGVEEALKMLEEMKNGERKRFEIEFRMKHKDGHWVDILSRADTLLDEKGEATRMIGTHVDISELKRIEKRLKVSENRLKQEKERAELYLDLLSHDIGNLHQGMSSFAQFAYSETKEKGPLRNYIRSISELANRSQNLIQNVKVLSRLKEITPEIRSIDLLKVVDDSISVTEKMFPVKKVTINYNPPKEPIIIDAEPLVQNIFVNLLHNGIKVQMGEKIRIDIIINEHKEDNCVTISIEDFGPGIPDKMKEDLFNRKSQSVERKHTGIGLSLVKELVRRYNGKIEVLDRVEGTPEEGARFLVTFQISSLRSK